MRFSAISGPEGQTLPVTGGSNRNFSTSGDSDFKKGFSKGGLLLRTPRPLKPRDGPTRNFHEKYQKIPLGQKFWNPKKIPPKYRKNTKNAHFWYFGGMFFRYFRGILGVNSGSPEFRAAGYFFGIFRGNSGSGHFGAL